MDIKFPLVRQADGRGGYVELYKCWRHGLTFATQELASIHYSVDHLGKTARRSGYYMAEGK